MNAKQLCQHFSKIRMLGLSYYTNGIGAWCTHCEWAIKFGLRQIHGRMSQSVTLGLGDLRMMDNEQAMFTDATVMDGGVTQAQECNQNQWIVQR